MRILLSINPEHVEEIRKGNKKFEFRKVLAKKFENNEILVYQTAPLSKVVGILNIKNTHIDTPFKIWELTKKYSGVNEDFYFKYFNNKSKAIAYEIYNFTEFEQPKDLIDFGINFAPQSFVYVD